MFSYLSPFIGHVVLSKMKPQTKYFYKVWHLSGMRRALYKNQWILIYEPMHPSSGKKTDAPCFNFLLLTFYSLRVCHSSSLRTTYHQWKTPNLVPMPPRASWVQRPRGASQLFQKSMSSELNEYSKPAGAAGGYRCRWLMHAESLSSTMHVWCQSKVAIRLLYTHTVYFAPVPNSTTGVPKL